MKDPGRRYAVRRQAANRIAFLVAILYCCASVCCSTSPWILYPLTSLVLHLLLAILFAAYLCATPLALISSHILATPHSGPNR